MLWHRDTRQLTEKELIDVYNRLLLHVLKRYQGIARKLPGTDLEDIVHETFADVLDGKRKLRLDQPVFFGMCCIAGSKISHRWEVEKRRVLVEDRGGFETSSFFDLALDEFSRENPHLKQPINPTDSQLIYNELCYRILQLVVDDDLLTAIVNLWIAIPDLKPQDIARKLGLEISQMQQAQKRLRSKVNFLKEVWANA